MNGVKSGTGAPNGRAGFPMIEALRAGRASDPTFQVKAWLLAKTKR